MSLEIIGVENFPIIEENDDLSRIICDTLNYNNIKLEDDDVLVLAETVVSKAEGNYVKIEDVVVSDKAKDWKQIYAAVCGAGRALGFVCAPSLFQKIIARCIGQTSDISIYEKNRDILYRALTEYGYRCIKPDGAFYLFVEALEKDANAFSERAKEHELLLVPADSFGTPGFVRISYCVSTEQIEKALPGFKALAESYK